MTVALGPDRFDPRVAPLRVMARLDGGVAAAATTGGQHGESAGGQGEFQP